MVCYQRFPHLIKIEERQLLVGVDDASILVYKDVNKELSPEQEEVVRVNEVGTKLWGSVISIVPAQETRTAMLDLARFVSKRLRTPLSLKQKKRRERIRTVVLVSAGISASILAGISTAIVLDTVFKTVDAILRPFPFFFLIGLPIY